MKYKIDLENWKRKQHFDFFQQFEEPFHGVNVLMDMTIFLNTCLLKSIHKSSAYFHKCMRAVNDTPAFRLRIEDNEVYQYERVDMGMTVIKDDRTFAYSYTEYSVDFPLFMERMRVEFEATRNGSDLRRRSTNHQIHGSVLPWINFTGLSHARWFGRNDSVPKITFGKIHKSGDRFLMPLSVHVHHAIVDGIDVADFIQLYQEYLNEV